MFKEAGDGAIAEVGTQGYSRDVLKIKKISRLTGVHIICATGFIKESYFTGDFLNLTEAELTKKFVDEVEEGIDHTAIRAGVIKIGASYNKFSEA
ncbi:MAG: hypothetical protein GX860_11215 [Alcaligenaceae bacterium]|jgi:phosphotriesterase-related protein|nr:hypothetical protein [Alcaligenaceae bacterium]